MTDPRRTTIARFTEACAADPLVAAAFLGGSFATGTADAFSDLDLYVVTEDDDYDRFLARHEEFMRSWAEPVFLDTTVDFEGFGFDMLHFVLVDGVSGEVALGHRSNVLALHGGPHEVLVDKASLLEQVSFPLYEPSADDRRRQIERALHWFWLDAIDLAKRIARGQVRAAQQLLASMRGRCELLVATPESGVVDDAALKVRLLGTFVAADERAIAAAAGELVALHRRVGVGVAETLGLTYPTKLAAVAETKLRRATTHSRAV
jgi:Nucleotidyltransferase domain